MLALAIALNTGQIGKFDDREPVATYLSDARLEDVERCLVGIAAPPQVYRQPDRPDDVMLVWSGVGLNAGNAAGRVDLHREGPVVTRVRAWLSIKWIEVCAPSKSKERR